MEIDKAKMDSDNKKQIQNATAERLKETEKSCKPFNEEEQY
jgi:hypothetical protein